MRPSATKFALHGMAPNCLDEPFLLPVYIGDTVTAHFVVRSVDRTKHRLEIDAWIENEASERVIQRNVRSGIAAGRSEVDCSS